MNTQQFSPFDRKILIVAVLCLLIFSYFLYDDHFFMNLFSDHGLTVAQVTQKKEDVRLKFASDFHWNNAVQGGTIYLGDSLFTGAQSGASVKFTDTSSAEIAENTLITFNKLGDKYIITLKQGKILSSTGNVEIVNEVPRAPASVEIPRPQITSPKTYTKKVLHVNPDDSYREERSVEVVWTYDKPLANFSVEYSKDPQFATIEQTQETKDHQIKSQHLREGSHFIRVRELDETNPKAAWSNVVQVEVSIVYPERTRALGAVHLKNPYIKKAINNPTPIVTEWDPVPDAGSYLVEVAKTEDFKESKKYQIKDTRYVISDYKPGNIFYHVTPIDEKNAISEDHADGKMDIFIEPPTLVATKSHFYWAKNSKDESVPWEFNNRWLPIPTVQNYFIEIAQSADFKDPIVQSRTDKTQHSVKLKDGKYFWRVKALRPDGTTASDFSTPGQFSYAYEKQLPSPVLVEPAKNMTLFFQKKKDTPFYLTWDSVERATEYEVEVATDPKFTNPVFSQKLSGSKVLLSDAIPRGNLYWHVRASVGDHVSDWSEVRKMMVFAGRSAQGR